MTDFWDRLDECRQQVRAERIAGQPVVTLRPDMTACQRAELALNSLDAALDVLEMVSDATSINGQVLERLSDVEIRLSLIRPRLRMKKSLIHLTSSMGRAP